MTTQPWSLPWSRATGCVVVVLLIGTASAQQTGTPAPLDPAVQQTSAEVPAEAAAVTPIPATANPGGVVQAGCSTCGSGLFGHPDYPDHIPQLGGNGCASSPCVPGRRPCNPCLADTYFGNMLCGIYECICCKDPCYEGNWLPIADSAFFVESARPKSQQRVRLDYGSNLVLPDRSEFFWARADGMGKGPSPTPPFAITPSLTYTEASLYTEVGVGGFAMLTEFPYRSYTADDGPSSSGFGDIMIGTKSLLHDCELMQLGFMFKTFILTGRSFNGLGTGHVSLEFSLLHDVKLAKETYLETQISEWVPISGDPMYAGSITHFHASLNQVLFRMMPNVPLIGTLELFGYYFGSGQYTDPILGSGQPSGGGFYLYPAVGLRLFICDRIDFGGSAAFAVTEQHFAEQLFRFEFRWRL